MIVLSKNLGSLEEFGKPKTTKSGLQTDNQQETKKKTWIFVNNPGKFETEFLDRLPAEPTP